MTEPTLLRVDVAGVPVMVRGEQAYEHLARINHALAVAKMALHKIAAGRPSYSEAPAVAANALEDMK